MKHLVSMLDTTSSGPEVHLGAAKLFNTKPSENPAMGSLPSAITDKLRYAQVGYSALPKSDS